MRWFKLLLVVLIAFGIYSFRDYLIEGLHYTTTLGPKLLPATALVGLSMFSYILRMSFIVRKSGGDISIKDCIKAVMVSFTAVLSIVKVGVGIVVYYLTRKGLLLSQAVTYYIWDRASHVVATTVIGIFVLGSWNVIGGLSGLGAIMALAIVGLILGKVKLEALEDFQPTLKRLVGVKTVFWLLLLSTINIVVDSGALALLTGAGWKSAMAGVLVGNMMIWASPVPGGLGLYEAAVPLALIAGGVERAAAIGGVLAYRLLSLWVPALLGVAILHREL